MDAFNYECEGQLSLFDVDNKTEINTMPTDINADIKLFNDDCLNVLKTIPNKSIDLVVIDPPYEFNGCKGAGAFGTDRRNYHEEYLKLYHEETDKVKKEGFRISARQEAHRKETQFISKGFDLSLLDELDRIMSKTNIYIWCSKAQVRKLLV